jgi:hypothetical protein
MRSLGPAFGLLPFAVVAILSAQERTASASVCLASFRYPASWELVPAPDTTDPRARCSVTLRPKDWASRLVKDDSLDRYSIQVTVEARSVDETLENASFEHEGARWFVTGGAGSRDSASAIAGPGWRGAYGITRFRCFRLGADGVAALCDLPIAAFGTPQRSATILGGMASEETVTSVLASFRFSPRRPPNQRMDLDGARP